MNNVHFEQEYTLYFLSLSNDLVCVLLINQKRSFSNNLHVNIVMMVIVYIANLPQRMVPLGTCRR